MSSPGAGFRVKLVMAAVLTLLIAGALIATGRDEEPPVGGLSSAAGAR